MLISIETHITCDFPGLKRFKPSSKIYFTDRSKAVLLLWIVYVFSVLCLLCLCERLFICALWSLLGKV